MARSHVKIYLDFDENTEMLNEAEKGRLLLAAVRYAADGTEPDLKGNERILWPIFRGQIDRDIHAYEQKASAGQAGGYASGEARNEANRSRTKQAEAERSKPKQNEAERTKTKDKDDDEDEEKDKDRSSTRAREGFPPTDAEIAESLERDRQIEAAAQSYGLPCKEGQMLKARDLTRDYSLPWLLRAIQTAGGGKEQTWRYVEGILRSWKQQGGPDKDGRKNKLPDGRLKTVSAQAYAQRDYSEAELMAVGADLIAEAQAYQAARAKEGVP